MAAVICLSQCPVGSCGKIVELATRDSKMLGKMLSLGIVPGASFRLLRLSPGVLLLIGHTLVALDTCLAAVIQVSST